MFLISQVFCSSNCIYLRPIFLLLYVLRAEIARMQRRIRIKNKIKVQIYLENADCIERLISKMYSLHFPHD